jgi:predicted component of type VI protein secretion system
MALELRIEGPGLDVVRRLEPGQPELVLGRGSECGVCLPDPQRKVSRKHLSVWVEAGELHFHVLSVVNGVEMPFGEAPPGARGVLPAGQTLTLSEYRLTAKTVPDAARHPHREAIFDREHSGFAPFGDTEATPLMPSDTDLAAGSDGDPFGEWEFEATFRPRGPHARRPEAGSGSTGTSIATDLSAFFQGLGLDAASLGPLSPGELETIGKLVRVMVRGLLRLQTTAAGVKEDLRAEDRTLVGRDDSNPLKADWPEETKLRYLFGGRSAGAGLVHPERALRELVEELVMHEVATGKAVGAVLGSTLAEFDPAKLRAGLLGDGFHVLANTRAWDAYSRFYEEQARDLDRWAQRLLDRYFAEAYLRESMRIRRETVPREH